MPDTSALVAAVLARGGVARTSSLAEDGFSRHHVRRSIDASRLVRVRPGWVAVPDADPELVRAARAGVVLSCITQAVRLGLWVDAVDRPHVAAHAHASGGKPRGVTVHWAVPVVPRHPDQLVDPIENVLALVATCRPFESARTVWESAFHTRLVTPSAMARLSLGPAGRRLVDEAWTFFDSGLETIFATRLRWIGVRILSQAWILDRPTDFLIGDRLVVQIDGGHHVGRQRTSDIAHDAQLRLVGYHVIRFSYEQVMEDWPAVQQTILAAIAMGLHRVAG